VSDVRRAALERVLLRALAGHLATLERIWVRAGDRMAGLTEAVGARAEPDDAVRAALEGLPPRAPGAPLSRVAGALGLSLADELVVVAAWLAETDPQAGVLLGCAHDDARGRHASLAAVGVALAPYGIPVPPVLESCAPAVRGGALVASSAPLAPLRLTPTALLLLAGTPPVPLACEPPVERLRGSVDAVADALLRGRPVHVRGRAAGDAVAVAVAAAASTGRPAVGGERSWAERRLLAATGAVPVVRADELCDDGWGPGDGALLVVGRLGDSWPGAVAVDLPPASVADRRAAWSAALRSAGLDAAPAEAEARRLAARVALADGDVATVALAASALAAAESRPVTPADPWRALRHAAGDLGGVGFVTRPRFRLEDLVLEPPTRRLLDGVVARVRVADVVLDGWGYRERLRGGGVAALFAGPPGTGKTTAAEAVAGELGRDLLCVDLSLVVSKWVGETEQNLGRAFDAAERTGSVLLFDEADALFGRRGEVRDGSDRYANLEVSYLLQRLEVTDAVVLLATNRQAALDEAFLRRLAAVVPFEQPDRPQRADLWRRAFPPAVPLRGVDADELADADLSGGHIVAAALAAAVLAAADGGVVTPAHVRAAVRDEYDKLGRAWHGALLPEST
jgi:hypothetical protein